MSGQSVLALAFAYAAIAIFLFVPWAVGFMARYQGAFRVVFGVFGALIAMFSLLMFGLLGAGFVAFAALPGLACVLKVLLPDGGKHAVVEPYAL
ncbi:hypothetical protein ACFQ14_16830 [Pseudahrensia aquimaris]|uniref:Uncharacterized protein n=1 Tax=Pseudahrensia aquimaris TaxID=744461 RepID=A0ABW3FIY6_9HYPH